jgi:hypothetical protein
MVKLERAVVVVDTVAIVGLVVDGELVQLCDSVSRTMESDGLAIAGDDE